MSNIDPTPVEIDPEIADEFLEEFEDHYTEIEAILLKLEAGPNNIDLLNDLFRRVHTIKGNLQIISLNHIAEFMHALENVLGKIRQGDLKFDTKLSDVILLSLDHGRSLFRSSVNQEIVSGDITGTVLAQLIDLALNPGQRIASRSKQIAATLDPNVAKESATHSTTDIDFFENLASSLEIRSLFWQGRIKRLLMVARDLNEEAGFPVDREQLDAAIYLHDVGMAFLPLDILHKTEKLTGKESSAIRQHPILAAKLLANMARWKDAEQMVLQHHERVDGTGYPDGLNEESICDGAKIIAIADTFDAMTQERANRDHKRPLIRAISEINNFSGYQFSPKWVAIFNNTVRRNIKNNKK